MNAALFLAVGLLALSSARGETVSGDGFSFVLPFGWYQVPKADPSLVAVRTADAHQFFSVKYKIDAACPIPCEEKDASWYERSYWERYDLRFTAAKGVPRTIVGTGFRLMNGVPFHILDYVSDLPAPTNLRLYGEVAVTSGNGRIYALVSVSQLPFKQEPEKEAILRSFTFNQPPAISWIQRINHHMDYLAVAAPLTVILIVPALLWKRRHLYFTKV